MSRIGKVPITIPQGVTASIKGNHIEVKGPKGLLKLDHNEHVTLSQKDGEVIVKIVGNVRQGSAYQGLYNRLIANMVKGVVEGFKKELEIQGVGYRAKMEGKGLNLSLGFSHPINFAAPEGITLQARHYDITAAIVNESFATRNGCTLHCTHRQHRGKNTLFSQFSGDI